MSDLLIRNADVVVTMNPRREELSGADVRVRDGVIVAVGFDLGAEGAEVVEARGCVVTPGLVNTHHHLYQSLTRAVPGGQDALLFGWLKTLYPIWARFGPEEMFTSAQVGLAELALSGCTMTSDHLYLYPNGARLDDTIAAAQEVGLRFHPTRGAMSIGISAGGLPPDSLVEPEAAILEDMIRVVDRFHNPRPGAMLRVGTPDEILRSPADDYVKSFIRGVNASTVFTAADIARKTVTFIAGRAECGSRAVLNLLEEMNEVHAQIVDAEQLYLGTVSVMV